MATTAFPSPSPEEVLPCWLEELQANDRAQGTIRRYRSAVEGFLTFSTLTPIALVGYRNYVQRTQHRATSEPLVTFVAFYRKKHADPE
jgi:hypothetical protein